MESPVLEAHIKCTTSIDKVKKSGLIICKKTIELEWPIVQKENNLDVSYKYLLGFCASFKHWIAHWPFCSLSHIHSCSLISSFFSYWKMAVIWLNLSPPLCHCLGLNSAVYLKALFFLSEINSIDFIFLTGLKKQFKKEQLFRLITQWLFW